ncbi:hypothetical protein [Flagellimonas sp. CMM7]|uniref:hypothetical protein n=1 Tax=Flagellimonas sp. CMM7 TaxID=2654676 RepID=UPI0013D74453|nr:hypothetical protein [Flagellimonas sp. CMM7]UII78349.1 hypothetical protein LV704_11780 [Flagellimonas sp. CMM7]
MFLKKLILYSMLFNAVICAPEDDFEDCSLVDCAAVDDSVYFEFIDNTTGANLITNGTYQAAQITISDADTNTIDFEVQKDFENQDILIIDIQNTPIGEQTYQISLADTTTFTFNITTFDGAGSFCCGPYTGIDDASLSGIAGELTNSDILPVRVTVFVPE